MLPVCSGRRLLMLVLAVLAAAIIASPTFAQTTGMVKGTVVDEKGRPIEGARITIESKDAGVNRTFTVTSNKKGEFAQIGIPPGQYRVTAEKANIGAQAFDMRVRLGDPTEVKFQLVPGSGVVTKEQQQKMAAQVQALFDAGVAATRASDYDTAITKFQEVIGLLPNCFDCYYNIGQANAQKKDYAKAEESFKKAIELKPDYAEAYNGLATIYNAQKKFDEATAASQKAAEIGAAAGPGGAGAGGGNVNALYNQGVIAWNAGRAEEAKAKFEEALKVDPNHPASHFQLAMCLVNLGKLADAAAEFETYLKLAPDGEYAAQAKALIAQLPKK